MSHTPQPGGELEPGELELFVPHQHTPLPEQKRGLIGHNWPKRLIDESQINSPTPARSHLFNCSCGANPLNEPHNLAVLAGAYTPIPNPYPETNSPAPPLPHSPSFASTLPPREFYQALFETLPPQLREALTSPAIADNMRSITTTTEDSPLIESIALYWPNHYRPPFRDTRTRAKPDKYNHDDWHGWAQVHRADVIAANPHKYVKNLTRSNPQPPLGEYTPALPIFHPQRRLSSLNSLTHAVNPPQCWCGAHLTSSHLTHLYEAFVGRTMGRAMEILTQPWQEASLGKMFLSSIQTPVERGIAARAFRGALSSIGLDPIDNPTQLEES